jgi:hypothetical protein
MQSVYADQKGVHILWAPPRFAGGKGAEFTYSLDSPAAQQLQACYSHLAKLGYPVIGLAFLQAEPAAPPDAPTAAAPARVGPSLRTPLATPSADRKDRPLIARLHPAAPDEPNRVLVAPVADPENLQVLVAPEQLARALYAAASPARPVDERLSYLRCRPGKNGLKIVEVGIGAGETDAPGRWQEVASWWEAAQRHPAAGIKTGPAAAPKAQDPELNLG